jgi:riboflavin synthase
MKEDGVLARPVPCVHRLVPWGVFRFVTLRETFHVHRYPLHGELRNGAALMFTGIIEGVGTIAAGEPRGGDMRLRIATGTLPFDDVRPGESIAVNGVCLTVVAFDASSFEVDASTETLALTTLGRLQPGAAVNLERAMRPNDRLGGHLVSGHVDGVGAVVSVHDDARAQRWRFSAPAALLRYVAKKGSICVDGVSLTVNEVDADGFEVALVPHTVAHTAFSSTHVGDVVNLEIDLVARYVERLLTGDRA